MSRHSKAGVISSSKPVVTAYSEIGVDNQGSGWLKAAGTAPDTTRFLVFVSYTSSFDGKAVYMGLLNTNSNNGITQDFHNGTNGTQSPSMFVPISGAANRFLNAAEVALGIRQHVLISGNISDGSSVLKMWVWDSTSGGWINVGETVSSGATIYTFTTDQNGFTWFASVGGQRKCDLVTYRSAFWTGNEITSFPDINSAAVRDTFAIGGNIVDPAVSIAAYGTPLHEPENTVAGMNAGTNIGTGGSYTVSGAFAAG